MRTFSLRWRLVGLALLIGPGCRLADHGDSRACPQTYEFGNTGCAIIAGLVTGTSDQPLAGFSVGPRSSADGGQFNTVYATTDAAGRFQLHLTRYASALADSASVWIRAASPPSSQTQGPAVHDSILVRLRVSPVGQIPDTAYVDITLPVP